MLLGLSVAATQERGESTSAPVVEIETLKADLSERLRTQDASKFLSYTGKAGVRFGVDGDRQSKVEIAKQLRRKTGAYCFLFESNCMPHPRSGKRPCSMHELIVNAKIESRVGRYGEKPQANAGFETARRDLR